MLGEGGRVKVWTSGCGTGEAVPGPMVGVVQVP